MSTQLVTMFEYKDNWIDCLKEESSKVWSKRTLTSLGLIKIDTSPNLTQLIPTQLLQHILLEMMVFFF